MFNHPNERALANFTGFLERYRFTFYLLGCLLAHLRTYLQIKISKLLVIYIKSVAAGNFAEWKLL